MSITSLVIIALAPVVALCIYFYIRDKYEKEPFKMLCLGLFYGALISMPILKVENIVVSFMPIGGKFFEAFYSSFLVASLVEELFKFIIVCLLVLNNKNFNEKFDGIVYGVFISLGFATVENVLYVINPIMGGFSTGLMRAIYSVPAHAFFGVCMGYYFALFKFDRSKINIFKAFFYTFILHGLYDFILLTELKYMMIPFIIVVVYLWVSGFYKMKKLINQSPFKEVD